MALQVWLPLNGDLHNQGLSDVTVTNNGATVSNAGKIGKCYEFGTSASYMDLPTAAMSGLSEASVCLWLYINSFNTSWATYFQAGGASVAWTSYTFGLLRNSSTSKVCFCVSNGSSSTQTSCNSPDLTLGKWYHFTLTYKSGHILMYINGELHQDFATSIVPNFASISRITIGKSTNHSNYQTDCSINDFRIYDHALSKREVKDIAKGLVLHYKLDDRDILMSKCKNVTYNQLIYDGNFNSLSNWRLNAGTNTLSVNNNIMTETFSGTATAWYHAGIVSNTQFTLYKNHKYFISFDVKSNKNIAIRGGYTKPTGYYTNITVQPNEWYHKIQIKKATSITSGDSEAASISIIIDDARQMSAGDWIKYRKVMFVDLTLMFGSGNEPTAEEADIIFDHYMPYNTGEVMDLSMPILDCSGYNNDGTIIGELSLSDDSPRYGKSAVFDGVSSGIQIDNLYISNIINTAVTYSFWIKPNGENGARSVYFGSYSSTSWSIEKYTNNLLRSWWNGALNYYPNVSITDNAWQMITITKNGTNEVKFYLNGVLKETNTSTHSALTFPTTFRIGRDTRSNDGTPYKGLMSDFRIYSTALSEKDIQELYNLSVWVDKGGNLNSFNNNEITTSPKVKKTGEVDSTNFVEYGDYLKVLDDGSLWVRILHHNNPASNLFTTTNCWWYDDDTNLYSALGVLKSSEWNNENGEYEFLACEKLTSSSTEAQYRWKQTSNPATSNTLSGYVLISGSPGRNIGLMNKGTQACFHNGNGWWCACGSYTQYSGGIPGFGGVVTTGYMDLYVRVNDIQKLKGLQENRTAFYKDSILTNQLIEI